jgi:hypothetical protein
MGELCVVSMSGGGGGISSKGAPQSEQNLVFVSACFPHFPQNDIIIHKPKEG